jgi:hypothetical protein
MDRLGLGVSAHASAALNITSTNQHIRFNNGSELGIIDLDSDGELNIWAHGDGEVINLRTGSGAGTDIVKVNSTGIDVTGTATMNGLTVDGSATINANTTSLILNELDTTDENTQLLGASGTFRIRTRSDDGATNTERLRIDHGTGDISFYEDTGTTPKFFWDASAEGLNVGGSTNYNYDINVGDYGYGINSTGVAQIVMRGTEYRLQGVNASPMTFYTSNLERMRIDSSGRLLVGQSVNYPATGGGTTKGVFSANADSRTDLIVTNQNNGSNAGAALVLGAYGHDHIIESQSVAQGSALTFTKSTVEHMRIDSSGNVLVGQAVGEVIGVGNTTEGISLGADGRIFASYNGQPAYLNRNGTDGALLGFYRGGTTVGSIGTVGGDLAIYSTSSSHAGLRFAINAYLPTDNAGVQIDATTDFGTGAYRFKDIYLSGGVKSSDISGSAGVTTIGATGTSHIVVIDSRASAQPRLEPSVDNSVDLGRSALRFDDIYATNGTIQTSDAREKTEVREFTDSEMRVAKKLSKNIGFFQWLASVEEKGDDARLHCGQTVQSVIAEFEAEGLDAFDYAMICYNEWDAETVEHPAVEAADAWTETTQEAGDRYSLRTDQLNHFMVKGLAQAQEELEARIAALEA